MTDKDGRKPSNTPMSGNVRAIVEHASYLEADRDVAFLNRNHSRALRLQLDFFKAEQYLEARGIEHTIVVFGSTRIPEPAKAQANVRRLEGELSLRPDDAVLRRELAMARSIQAKSHYYDTAREFARIASSAKDHPQLSNIVVMTGGGPGIMEAANRGAYDADAPTIGLNITLPREQQPNPYITPGLCFQFHYFAIRKLHFLLRARALVAFPGGFGTFDELFEVLTLIQTRTIAPLPVVLVGETFWRSVFNPDRMIDEGVISPSDRDLFTFAETAEGIWACISEWYARTGRAVVDGGAT